MAKTRDAGREAQRRYNIAKTKIEFYKTERGQDVKDHIREIQRASWERDKKKRSEAVSVGLRRYHEKRRKQEEQKMKLNPSVSLSRYPNNMYHPRRKPRKTSEQDKEQ